MNLLLDWFFTLFHGVFTLFNLSGWAFKKTRRLHLLTIGLTVLSWFGLGLFYGWGYCPFTDWHWRIKYELGEVDLPASYIKYYLDKLTGLTSNAQVVGAIVLILGLSAFVLSCRLNWKDWYDSRDKKQNDTL